VPLKHLATVPRRYEQVFSIQAQPALPAPPARLLLEDGGKGKQVAIPHGTQLLPTTGIKRLLSTKVDRNRTLVCAKYTTFRPIINGVHAYPSQVHYTNFIPPLPKRQRASPASTLEQGPRQPPFYLRILSERIEGLSNSIRGLERARDLSTKVMTGITKQVGENIKSIRELKCNNKKLEGEVHNLKKEIQDLNTRRQP